MILLVNVEVFVDNKLKTILLILCQWMSVFSILLGLTSDDFTCQCGSIRQQEVKNYPFDTLPTNVSLVDKKYITWTFHHHTRLYLVRVSLIGAIFSTTRRLRRIPLSITWLVPPATWLGTFTPLCPLRVETINWKHKQNYSRSAKVNPVYISCLTQKVMNRFCCNFQGMSEMD